MSSTVLAPGAAGTDERLTGVPGEPLAHRRYRRMRFIRRFEETLLQLFEEGALNGTTHACIGQEADAVAVTEHLTDGDHIFSNHRCHGHYLAHSGDALGLMAEIMGKEAGVCRGMGGSQHICAPGFKSNGVQGGIVPNAAGIAMANQLEGNGAVSVVFIGDGTLGEGVVYETLNMAALWKLPLLVVCEDNRWAQSTPVGANLAGDMAARFSAFGVPVREVDSTDVEELSTIAGEEVAAVRSGDGPRVLLIHTYRLCHHSKSDDERPQDEIDAHWLVEPLVVHGRRLGDADQLRIDDEVETALSEVVATARALA
ncbi:thiamine pyrophosphate-dependent dehydrogenase E1 component subunit alpha [Actinoplanes sp. NPDC023801]|uniref:thiamine pyrophosphate-dependent dehydrogenase E1 component subunit alpha n=1 Tax=Actinoplanes sp. NPDC023801 TaxID=3154595 RepID=UPI0033FF8A28